MDKWQVLCLSCVKEIIIMLKFQVFCGLCDRDMTCEKGEYLYDKGIIVMIVCLNCWDEYNS